MNPSGGISIDRNIALKCADALLSEIQSDGENGFGKVTITVERGEITFVENDRKRKGLALLALVNVTR
jgi:hypothetical protein